MSYILGVDCLSSSSDHGIQCFLAQDMPFLSAQLQYTCSCAQYRSMQPESECHYEVLAMAFVGNTLKIPLFKIY